MIAPVDLYMCVRCRLRWVPDGEKYCPRCRLHHSIPTEPVVVAGVQVPVATLRDYGLREGLLDADVRRGLDVLVLGDRCKCGYISTLICPKCSVVK